jgi:signal peptidase II
VPRKYLILLAVALTVVVLDQWTKYLIVQELTTRFDGLETVGQRLSALYGEQPEEPLYGRLHYRPRRHIEVIDSFFRLRYAENPGAAWGLFGGLAPRVRGPLFHVVVLGAVVLILWFIGTLSGRDPKERWALWGAPLVLGGALGNYIDRLARGFVIDFLEAHWYDEMAWPSFNVADMAIVLGVGLLMVDAFVRKDKPQAQPDKEPARAGR